MQNGENINTNNWDFSTSFLPYMIAGILLFLIVILLIILINLHYYRQQKHFKKNIGVIAEEQISTKIENWASLRHFAYIGPNLYKQDHKLFEIDGILITSKAIVVIEIKSINGHIIGDSRSTNWEKHIYNKVHPINNPVIQNERHLKHVVSMLGFKVPMLSLIVFSKRVEKLEIENSLSHVIITKEDQLFEVFNEIMELPTKMNSMQIKELEEAIIQYTTSNPQDIKEFQEIIYGNKK